jgi:hypothetical protein
MPLFPDAHAPAIPDRTSAPTRPDEVVLWKATKDGVSRQYVWTQGIRILARLGHLWFGWLNHAVHRRRL